MSPVSKIEALETKINQLEKEIEFTKALLDGSEMYTRDAAGYAIALLARFLHEKRVINAGELLAYVSVFKGDPRDWEDHQGHVVNGFAGTLEFQMIYPEDFELQVGRASNTSE
ncbi:hypothetical protein HPT29_018605 [Microvirga terrae]|uniref:Uncharacterized protein n=1 Tax=Microvirga terrae TaxID=2740529 RepID=A0ABY5RQA6_9HYPH|nr:hypothetical protein [Microvirga terrae]UVF18484.1 hypothetical protein HPT29_018605 [Microvirga terrae]